MSNKILAGGRRVTADLAPDVIKKLDSLRIAGDRIVSITETLEAIIRIAPRKIWDEK